MSSPMRAATSRAWRRIPRGLKNSLAPGAVQPVERQIGGDVESDDHAVIDVLVHGDDAGADRLGRGGWRKVLAVERDRAAVARIDAADDAHEGRFAGAVGAHQHGHLAGVQFKADAAKHLCRAKGFPQARYAEHGIWPFLLPPARTL